MINILRCVSALLLLAALVSCSEPSGSGRQDTTKSGMSQPQDSTYARLIDRKIDTMYGMLRTHPMPKREALRIYSEEDSVSLWIPDSLSAMLQIWAYPPDAEVWPAYFILDGEIVLVRFREWRERSALPFMRESMIYYKDGQPIYCEERAMKGQAGEKPFLLRLRPFIVSARSLDEIKADYAEFWPKLTARYPKLEKFGQQ